MQQFSVFRLPPNSRGIMLFRSPLYFFNLQLA